MDEKMGGIWATIEWNWAKYGRKMGKKLDEDFWVVCGEKTKECVYYLKTVFSQGSGRRTYLKTALLEVPTSSGRGELT